MKRMRLLLLLTVVIMTAFFAAACENDGQIESITVKDGYDIQYAVGQELKLDGDLVIIVKYKDGTTEEVTVKESMVSGFSSDAKGQTEVRIRYNGGSVKLTLTILEGYKVTLPNITGVTYEIPSGTTVVSEGQSFSFKIILHEAYDQSQPVITAGGNKLAADGSGLYTLSDVREHTQVYVDGIRKNGLAFGVSVQDEAIALTHETWSDTGVHRFKASLKYGYEGTFSLYANGILITPASDGYYTVSVVSKDIEITATGYTKKTFEVSFPALTGASVQILSGETLDGNKVTVPYRDYLRFRVNLEAGYSLSTITVKINGIEALPQSGIYGISVTKDSLVEIADIMPNPPRDSFDISLPKLVGASFEYTGGLNVPAGGSFSFKVLLDPDYDHSNITVKINDSLISPDASGNYVINNILADISVAVYGIAPNVEGTFAVVLPDVQGAVLKPVMPGPVQSGGSFSFSIVLDDPKNTEAFVWADNKNIPEVDGTYTLTNITSDIYVEAFVLVSIDGGEAPERDLLFRWYADGNVLTVDWREQPYYFGDSAVFEVFANNSGEYGYYVIVDQSYELKPNEYGTYEIHDIQHDISVEIIAYKLLEFSPASGISYGQTEYVMENLKVFALFNVDIDSEIYDTGRARVGLGYIDKKDGGDQPYVFFFRYALPTGTPGQYKIMPLDYSGPDWEQLAIITEAPLAPNTAEVTAWVYDFTANGIPQHIKVGGSFEFTVSGSGAHFVDIDGGLLQFSKQDSGLYTYRATVFENIVRININSSGIGFRRVFLDSIELNAPSGISYGFTRMTNGRAYREDGISIAVFSSQGLMYDLYSVYAECEHPDYDTQHTVLKQQDGIVGKYYEVNLWLLPSGQPQSISITLNVIKKQEWFTATYDAGEGRFEDGSCSKQLAMRMHDDYQIYFPAPLRSGYLFGGWAYPNDIHEITNFGFDFTATAIWHEFNKEIVGGWYYDDGENFFAAIIDEYGIASLASNEMRWNESDYLQIGENGSYRLWNYSVVFSGGTLNLIQGYYEPEEPEQATLIPLTKAELVIYNYRLTTLYAQEDEHACGYFVKGQELSQAAQDINQRFVFTISEIHTLHGSYYRGDKEHYYDADSASLTEVLNRAENVLPGYAELWLEAYLISECVEVTLIYPDGHTEIVFAPWAVSNNLPAEENLVWSDAAGGFGSRYTYIYGRDFENVAKLTLYGTYIAPINYGSQPILGVWKSGVVSTGEMETELTLMFSEGGEVYIMNFSPLPMMFGGYSIETDAYGNITALLFKTEMDAEFQTVDISLLSQGTITIDIMGISVQLQRYAFPAASGVYQGEIEGYTFSLFVDVYGNCWIIASYGQMAMKLFAYYMEYEDFETGEVYDALFSEMGLLAVEFYEDGTLGLDFFGGGILILYPVNTAA